MLNDVSIIMGFACGRLAAYLFGTGKLDETAGNH
jgi:hypothetical protein